MSDLSILEARLKRVQETLIKIDETLAQRASEGTDKIEFTTPSGGKRRIDKTPILDLVKLKDAYLKEIQQLEKSIDEHSGDNSSGMPGRKIQISFDS